MQFNFHVDTGLIVAINESGEEREAWLNADQSKMTHEIALAIMTANTIEGDMSREAKAARLNFFMWAVFNMFERATNHSDDEPVTLYDHNGKPVTI